MTTVHICSNTASHTRLNVVKQKGTWMVVSGRLPKGLTLDPKTGMIHGVVEEENVVFSYRNVPDSAFPHRFETLHPLSFEMSRIYNQWCAEQWGIDPTSETYGGKRWWVRGATGTVMFAYENDAFAFKMRWC
jgi:hypothetical protein